MAVTYSAIEVAAVISFSGVVLSVTVAFITSSRTVYVNAITIARIRWLEFLSGKLAEYQSLHMQIVVETKHKEDDKDNAVKLNQLYATIRMQLNPLPLNESNVLWLMKLCSETYANYDRSVEYNFLFADHSNWLIKSEWKKIKAEAGSLLLRPFNLINSWMRQRRYLQFCENEGRIVDYTQVP